MGVADWTVPEDAERVWFDTWSLPEDRTAFGLGETAAGTLPDAIRRAFRQRLQRLLAAGTPLAAIGERLSRFLCEGERPFEFVCLLVAVHDPRAATLEILAAGLPGSFLLRRGADAVHELPPSAPALGILEDLVLRDAGPPPLEIDARDILVCHAGIENQARRGDYQMYPPVRMREHARVSTFA